MTARLCEALRNNQQRKSPMRNSVPECGQGNKEVSQRFQRDAGTGKPLPRKGPKKGKGYDEAGHHTGDTLSH